MKILFLSDTHWKLWEVKNEIDFSSINLIVLLWDNTIEDLEIIWNINIPKIWILWNHKFREIDKSVWILDKYWITDITFKRLEFGWISFYWIDWQMQYQLIEDIQEKNNKLRIFNPNIDIEIKNYNEKKDKLLKQENINILISHFPARWIMDLNNFSHKWLNLIREFIEKKKPEYLFHWHIHNPWKEKLWNTEIIQVYKYYIIEI